MRRLTYSRNVFVPVTNLCRNRCGYCSFRREPGEGKLLSRSEVGRLLAEGGQAGCSEALFTLGEMPWMESGFAGLLSSVGASDFIEYLAELCEMALDEGLLPHTNAGVLSQEDLETLAPLNASLGLMLETTAHLEAHDSSPGKDPRLRLDFMARAGRLKIPFTTGILVGIGESRDDRIASLQKIAGLHQDFGHIQEVIIQPLDPKPKTALENYPPPGEDLMRQTVELARSILPSGVAVQVPPNLSDPLELARSGADDLGGISSITPDWINPSRPWPSLEDLSSRLKGYHLRERLPVYPAFILKGWYGERTEDVIRSLADGDGLRRKDYL
ncbi:MAG: 7,8-didemethyl-8-hydroxy-5-deazariboflavin synthase subunit CofG [Methanotrichaceae archaeon]|nr:7,8-didemethyl-8-hydroxy-5-deazariboflavin synthase subunit CofG [Methanotrichaceae archaeon]